MKKGNVIYFLFIMILITILVVIYNKYYFNDYLKSVKEPDKSSFYRDGTVKYSSQKSYCIESNEYNTAMFSKEITVKKNTPYKITCYVKTENVKNETEKKAGGANICITDTVEKSESIIGTTNWTKLEFMFNSKNREKVQIGFRLGSYDTNSKGKVYFSDIKMEEGKVDTDNRWDIGCFVFKNLDIEVEGKQVKTTMNNEDITLIRDDLDRFKKAIPEISENKMKLEYNTIYIEEPLTTISYDDSNGYYIDSMDVYEQIINTVKYSDYDHIFIIFKAEEINKINNNSLKQDWVGLRRYGFFRNRLFKYKIT